jgi:hypothetical protein
MTLNALTDRHTAMNKNQLENAALDLPLDQRIDLIQSLLLSIEQDSEQKIQDAWIEQAKSRAQQIRTGAVLPISDHEVRKKAKALLR